MKEGNTMTPMQRTPSLLLLAAVALAGIAGAREAKADFISFSASGSGGLSASASFSTSGDLVLVTLTNTSSMDVWSSSQVLTAVFFSVPGTLTPVVATVAPGSGVNNASWLGDALFPVVSGEWAFSGNLSTSFGANSGISSSGLGLFGSSDLFPPDINLAGPWSPDGIQYGITSAGDDPSTANLGLAGQALVQNSVVFILSGWNSAWSISDISNVHFQYGTSLSDPRLSAVPEPGVMALLGVGLVGLLFARRKLGLA